METQAPAVMALVVTRDPGPWFEEALRCLANQDYPNLSIVVVDAASQVDPGDRVEAVLPDAEIWSLATNAGFGPSANLALQMVDRATHLVLCHDDVAPDPDAVRQMVEEAFRSNAGVVAPKFVDWEQPDYLLQVGMAVDKGGVGVPRIDRGELDQEQHDAVRDVFAAPGGFSLVRSDLFATLGGFDPSIWLLGEDVDLCWRAQIAGARVVVAPGARVRHLQALDSGRRHLSARLDGAGPEPHAAAQTGADDAQTWAGDAQAGAGDAAQATLRLRLARRHELRTVLKAYGRWHLLKVLPQLALVSLVEVVVAVLGRRSADARGVLGAWRWNLARLGELRAARAAVQAARAVPDRDLRRLQSSGSARLAILRRSWVTPGRAPGPDGARLPGTASQGLPGWVASAATWAVVLLVMAFGSRHLITTTLPAVGQLSAWPSWSTFWHQFTSGWRPAGLGSQAPAPLAFAFMALGGLVALGHMSLLQHVAVLGLLPAGALGAWRLSRALNSRWARLTVVVAFSAVPLPYGALSLGRWDVLVAYAGAPWVLGILASSTGLEPFGSARPPGGRQALSLAVLVAALGAIVPAEVMLVVLGAGGLLVGSFLVGDTRPSLRALRVGLVGVAGAVLLSAPWTLGLLHPGAGLAALSGGGLASPVTPGRLVGLSVGAVGSSPLAWGLAVAAALPLLIGRGWRLAWAARLWTIALVFWALDWIGGRGWLGLTPPSPGILLAPAAAALALCVGLGVVSFQRDLPGYRFGWRQLASLVAAGGIAVGSLAVLGAALGGRWGLPAQGFDQSLAWMPGQVAQGSFRVLWLGPPQSLPLGSWPLASNLAYATSENGAPDATDLWPPADPGTSALLGQDVTLARQGLTTRLGHLLAPLAVRYVVVPYQLAPASGSAATRPPADLGPVLASQDDLRQLPGSPSLLVFEDLSWAPQRAEISSGAAQAAGGSLPGAALVAPLAGSAAVLPGPTGGTSFAGPVPAGTVLFSATASRRWVLTDAGGQVVAPQTAFGFAHSYLVGQAGTARLGYRSSPLYLGALGVQGLLWVLALAGLAGRGPLRSSRAGPPSRPTSRAGPTCRPASRAGPGRD